MRRLLIGRERSALRSGTRGKKLITATFLIVLALTFLGFAIENLLRPVIPLVVVDRGGGSLAVGVIAALHALPSLLLRPLIGRLVDGGYHERIMRLGAFVAAAASLGTLLPGMLWLASARFVQGGAWALYSVATQTHMARHAPQARRAEANGYFQATQALASLIAPAIGVGLYVATGELGPVLLSGAMGTIALAIAWRFNLTSRIAACAVESDRSAAPATRNAGMIERSALPIALMVSTFMAAHSLFSIFPPLYALSIHAPTETLIVHFLAFGAVAVLSQLLVGRVSDHLGRGRTIRIGASLAIAGLVTAAVGGGMATFTAGGCAFAVSMGLVIPATGAMTIDQAAPSRIGASMATYSLGFQLAGGLSSLLWGALIDGGGFPSALVGAVTFQLLTILVSLRYARRN